MLFDATLTAVFEKIAFNLTKISQGTLFRAFFCSKSVFLNLTYGSFSVFVRVFNSVQLS
jgi:hypothetical protein